MGKRVLLFCLNYAYTGMLEGVNDSCVLLADAAIVYETGAFGDKTYKDAQKVGGSLYVQTGCIESFMESDRK